MFTTITSRARTSANDNEHGVPSFKSRFALVPFIHQFTVFVSVESVYDWMAGPLYVLALATFYTITNLYYYKRSQHARIKGEREREKEISCQWTQEIWGSAMETCESMNLYEYECSYMLVRNTYYYTL